VGIQHRSTSGESQSRIYVSILKETKKNTVHHQTAQKMMHKQSEPPHRQADDAKH